MNIDKDKVIERICEILEHKKIIWGILNGGQMALAIWSLMMMLIKSLPLGLKVALTVTSAISVIMLGQKASRRYGEKGFTALDAAINMVTFVIMLFT